MKKVTSFLGIFLCLVLLFSACPTVFAADLIRDMEYKTFEAPVGAILPYRMNAPQGGVPEGEDGFAVFIHLHGAGERGTDNELQTSTGMELVRKIIRVKGEETIVLVPQCDPTEQWVNVPFTQGAYSTDEVKMSTYLTAVMELLDEIKKTYPVDENRIYLAGLSMGAYGTWDLLARYPDTFAAAIPVCGGGDPAKAEAMKEVAIRTYHSDDDPIVPVSGTRAMAEALTRAGGNIEYKEFTKLGHSCWTRAFNMADQVDWLFSQSRKAEEPTPSDPVDPTPSQPVVPAPAYNQGDVNEDTKIDAKDALDVLKVSVGKLILSQEALLRADVNLDNIVNAKDALDILKYTVGKLTEFPLREEPVTPPEEPAETPTEPPMPPVDGPLTDTSTGEIFPRLAAMTYSTEPMVADIVPADDGYRVWGDGTYNCTMGLQKALDDCAKAGGGTVFLPAGHYKITRALTIPSRVTLLGDWQDPDVGNDYGTVILACVASKDTNQEGLFNLKGSGGVVGITVYYPEQSLEEVKPYPPVFYTNGQGESYMLSTVKNCTVINGYRGIGACCHTVNPNAHEQLTVENVKGTFLHTAAEVYNQADVGTWENVVVSGRYWANAKGYNISSVNRDVLNQYTTNHTVGMTLGDLEWTEFSGLVVEHCNVGLKIVKGQRIQFAGSLYNISLNHCAIGILAEDLDPRWGMLIANSRVDNGIQNLTAGLVKTINVKLEGNGCLGAVETANDESIVSLALPQGGYEFPKRKLTVANFPKDGKTDVSAQLQSLLDERGTTGGIVYLPAGAYRLDAPITIPAGVQLRGSSAVAARGMGGNGRGTVILAYYGDDAATVTATDVLDPLITLAGENAGLYGLRITYPQNGPYDEDLSTTYAVKGIAKGVYLVNCCITAAGNGVDFSGCDNHYIHKVMTCCYYNAYKLGGKNGVMSGCLQNGTVLTRCGDPHLENWLTEEKIFNDLFNPILRKTAKFMIVENAQNQTVYNTFVYGSHSMITAENVTDLLAVNIGCDNIGSDAYQMHLISGSATVVNSMRYNGYSYKKESGRLGLYNRLTINNKTEKNGVY